MKQLIKQEIARLKSKTPPLANKVFSFMASLFGLGVGLAAFEDKLPVKLQGYSGYLIAIGIVGAYLSKRQVSEFIAKNKV